MNPYSDCTREQLEQSLERAQNAERIYSQCLSKWAERFFVLKQAWDTGSNDDVLTAVSKYLHARDKDEVTKQVENLEDMRDTLKDILLEFNEHADWSIQQFASTHNKLMKRIQKHAGY